ncbi:MAG TPA: nucleotide exchange factor GrpE [Thermoanaerobaculia bacterium]|nr:nucleotide exchange factor GrpE [Thermoanaerobaculia bacterium]
MADDTTERNEAAGQDVAELDLDAAQNEDLDAAMRAAVAAVEEVESGGRHEEAAAGGGSGDGDTSELFMLRREVADLRNRSMRTLADFDNFRKRSERERQEARRYALFEPLRDFLDVVDNLDLALASEGSVEDLKRGVEMIQRQMQELLRRHGVKEVPAAGEPFDPAVHEAVSREEDPAVKAPTVSAELRRGYMMHERLLRPAMVKVAVPAEGARPSGEGAGDGE